MRVRLRVFGRTVASLTYDAGPALELLEEEVETPSGITGGGTMYFERDGSPPDPSGEEPWYSDRGFGFQ